VVIAPSALHISRAVSSLASAPAGRSIAVALQDTHTATALGAYTGSHVLEQLAGERIGWEGRGGGGGRRRLRGFAGCEGRRRNRQAAGSSAMPPVCARVVVVRSHLSTGR
jgi:hypothetical protein